MSSNSRSLLFLLRRCVTGRQQPLPLLSVSSGIQARGSWLSHRGCHLLQQQTGTSACLQSSFRPLLVLKLTHLGLCTKVSCSCVPPWFLHGPSLVIKRATESQKFLVCLCAGWRTMGRRVPATASLPFRTRQEGGLPRASERSAMVLLS